MILASAILDAANDSGFGFVTGVPCSYLTPFIQETIADSRFRYIGATNEGDAVAIAAGTRLAGEWPIVFSQNSGLGNMVNPITSLSHPHKIPFLLIITWRGKPGTKDEPQHEVMGTIVWELLKLMNIPAFAIKNTPNELREQFAAAKAHMIDTGLPVALVVEHDTLVPTPDMSPPAPPSREPTERLELLDGPPFPRRVDVLANLRKHFGDHTAIISTTGKCSRELYTLGDRANQFYLVGAMGCASGVALGTAIYWTGRVLVADGDGAALMRLGNCAVVGMEKPTNLIHIVLDNGTHDSSGGQPTGGAHVDFAAIAAACGYATVSSCDSLARLSEIWEWIDEIVGPHFVHIRIAGGSMSPLGRPDISPSDVARRFAGYLEAAGGDTSL